MRLLALDEAWWGLRTERSWLWARRGIRPRLKVNSARQFVAVMSAVDPKEGAQVSWLYTRLNSACFSHFLSEVAATFADQEIWIVCDQATWHTANEVKVPERIKLKWLPPKTPEDNPAEWLWLWIRSHWTANRLLNTQEELIELLCQAIQALTPQIVRSIIPAFNFNV